MLGRPEDVTVSGISFMMGSQGINIFRRPFHELASHEKFINVINCESVSFLEEWSAVSQILAFRYVPDYSLLDQVQWFDIVFIIATPNGGIII